MAARSASRGSSSLSRRTTSRSSAKRHSPTPSPNKTPVRSPSHTSRLSTRTSASARSGTKSVADSDFGHNKTRRKSLGGEFSALIKATKQGRHEIIKDILKTKNVVQKLALVNEIDRNGSTLLFHAVWPGHLLALQVLLDNGADPNHKNNRQNTALHLACERGHFPVIQTLIDAGADVTIENWEKKVCWQAGASNEQGDNQEIETFVKKCTAEYRERISSQLVASVTPQQMAHFKSVFDAVDTDEDGFIVPEDIEPLLKSMYTNRPSADETKRFFEWMDVNKDGKVNLREFIRAAVAPATAAAAKATTKKGRKGRGAASPKGRRSQAKSRSSARSKSRQSRRTGASPASPSSRRSKSGASTARASSTRPSTSAQTNSTLPSPGSSRPTTSQ